MSFSECGEYVGNEKPQSIGKQKIGVSISDSDRIQTCNRWSRNPVRYSVAPRSHLIASLSSEAPKLTVTIEIQTKTITLFAHFPRKSNIFVLLSF